MRRVASAANCAVGSIYVHFSSKDGLFDAVAGPIEESFWRFYEDLESRDVSIAKDDIPHDCGVDSEEATLPDLRCIASDCLYESHRFILVCLTQR